VTSYEEELEARLDERDWSANIPLFLILTLLTGGIFNLFWNWRQMQACNAMLGRREFSWLRWVVLSLLTFLLYHLYYQYKMGAAIVEIQRRYEEPVFEDLPLVSLLATIFGFSVAADCIHQYEINKLAP
jgi:hypothetical protein